MSLEKQLRLLGILVFSVVLLLAGLLGATWWNQVALNESQQNRYDSYLLADELRQSSDDLTRLARTYVVTGDPKFDAEYWEIIDVRNGKKPRPDGQTISLRQLMELAGFTEEEFVKLKEAEDNSNSLVTTETIAMNAIQGKFDDGKGGYTRTADPDPELARRIMHDDKYHQDKAKIMAPIQEFEKMLDARTLANVQSKMFRGNVLLVGIGAAITALGVLFVLFLLRIKQFLLRTVDELEQNVGFLSDASSQIAASSESLADGASEQAALVQETSAACKQIHETSSRNSESSKEAAAVIGQAQQGISDATRSLDEMQTSMNEIVGSSEKILNIIRVIDEIAFQTNLLALNAAVEAARAGEAGKGFAVVAEEVRNLAHRCATAAKDTAVLIDDSVTRSRSGQQKVEQVVTAITSVTKASSAVQSLIGDVEHGSAGQLSSMGEISKAMAHLEAVMSSSAASAEQGAALGQELSVRADDLGKVVEKFQELVGKSRPSSAAKESITPVKTHAGTNGHYANGHTSNGTTKSSRRTAELIRSR